MLSGGVTAPLEASDWGFIQLWESLILWHQTIIPHVDQNFQKIGPPARGTSGPIVLGLCGPPDQSFYDRPLFHTQTTIFLHQIIIPSCLAMGAWWWSVVRSLNVEPHPLSLSTWRPPDVIHMMSVPRPFLMLLHFYVIYWMKIEEQTEEAWERGKLHWQNCKLWWVLWEIEGFTFLLIVK